MNLRMAVLEVLKGFLVSIPFSLLVISNLASNNKNNN